MKGRRSTGPFLCIQSQKLTRCTYSEAPNYCMHSIEFQQGEKEPLPIGGHERLNCYYHYSKMQAVLDKDEDHKRNMRRGKQGAPSPRGKFQRLISDFCPRAASLPGSGRKRGGEERGEKTAGARRRIGSSYLLITHKALLKLLGLFTAAAVDKRVRTGAP